MEELKITCSEGNIQISVLRVFFN